ncbi:unnamed protein product, partial [Meganyctiphanes norvegica]
MMKLLLVLSALGLAQAWPWQWFVYQDRARAAVSCGAHSMDVGETLTIESQNYPSKYPRDHTCATEITCADPDSQIDFTCPSFELQNSNKCAKDYLEISDADGVLEKACGAKNPPTDLTTATNTLSLNFVTNSDTTRKSGFSCTATCVQKHIPSCGSHSMVPGQTFKIQSENYPDKYPRN